MAYNLHFWCDALGQFGISSDDNLATGEMDNPSVDWTREEVRTVVDTVGCGLTVTGYFIPRRKTYSANQRFPNQVIATNAGGSEPRWVPEQLQAEIKIAQFDQLKAAGQPQLSLFEILAYRKLHPKMRLTKRLILTHFMAGSRSLYLSGGGAGAAVWGWADGAMCLWAWQVVWGFVLFTSY